MSKKKNEVTEIQLSELEENKAFAATVPLMASAMNAWLLEPFAKPITMDINFSCLVDALDSNIKEVQDGNMTSMEAMLVAQVQALQTIFVSLGLKASSQTNINHYTTFMTLALKAQSQVRSTILALAELKYPKQVAFVKQANIAHGNQQVNNGDFPHASRAPAHAYAEKNQNKQNKLLAGEQNGGTQMDKIATPTSGGKNTAMETVAE